MGAGEGLPGQCGGAVGGRDEGRLGQGLDAVVQSDEARARGGVAGDGVVDVGPSEWWWWLGGRGGRDGGEVQGEEG